MILLKFDIKHFIYIDKDAINSIYEQITNEQIPVKIKTTNYTGSSINGNVKSDSLIRRVISASIDGTAEVNQKIEKELENNLSIEKKIDEIIKKCFNNKVQRLSDIINKKLFIDNSFVVCNAIFRFEYAYDEDISKILKQTDISNNPFGYKNLSYSFSNSDKIQFLSEKNSIFDSSFESGGYYVDMFFNSSNMVRNVRHINNNVKYGKDFMFYVLGDLTFEGKNIFCLKPYVIWRMTNRNMQ